MGGWSWESTPGNMAASEPRKIDRYEILGKIAEGGMAEIFLAKQSGMEGFEKMVALKCILPSLMNDEDFVTMFLDEARIAARLNHPNIAQIYDLGRTEETLYIAMEHVSGRNLQQILFREFEKKRQIPIHHVCKILAGVCEGLHYAHEKKDLSGASLNLVHRDVTPQNILVSFDGNVKLVDFGIAKASSQVGETRAGVLKGKYAYMSPEQVRGWPLDARSDLFSVGVVLYELTGRRPFEQSEGVDTLRAIMGKKPVNPLKYNPEIPTGVMRILGRCLEKNPDRRYQSAQEAQSDFEDFLATSQELSTSVRLARYLEELFASELERQDGRVHVSGVGEVLLPAGLQEPGSEAPEASDASVKNDEAPDGHLSTVAVPNPVSQLGDDELFSEEGDGADLPDDKKSYADEETYNLEDLNLSEAEDDPDGDTVAALDVQAYHDYVARMHADDGQKDPDVSPDSAADEASGLATFEHESTEAEPVPDESEPGAPSEDDPFAFSPTDLEGLAALLDDDSGAQEATGVTGQSVLTLEQEEQTVGT